MENTKLGITRFFSGYFKNFHRIILANLLFSVPLVIFSVLFYFINTLTGLNLAFITFAPIIFVFPFFSGLTLITRNIVTQQDDINTVKLFFKGLKENCLYFFIHGIVLYLAIFLCYSSITLYWKLANENNGIFYFAFGIAVVIAVAMLFIFYNVPVMTVTFDLSLKNIYKNSALMALGEFKNNFFATLGLFLLFIFCATIFFTAPNAVILVIIMLVLGVLIVPSTASYIMNFYVYKDMESVISNGEIKSEELRKKIEAKQSQLNEDEKLDFSMLDLDENKDGEEYLYFNGKMIRRRVLIEMKKKQESSDE